MYLGTIKYKLALKVISWKTRLQKMKVRLKIWNLKKTKQLYNIFIRSGERLKTERHFMRKRESDTSSKIRYASVKRHQGK